MTDLSSAGDPGDQLTRRQIIKRSNVSMLLWAAQSLTPFVAAGCNGRMSSSASAVPRVKVGILHSQTGTMSLNESSLRDAELLAIEEINADGGVLGCQVEAIVEDTRSRMTTLFPQKAEKLLVEDQVAAVFGCWTSSSRRAVLPVFE